MVRAEGDKAGGEGDLLKYARIALIDEVVENGLIFLIHEEGIAGAIEGGGLDVHVVVGQEGGDVGGETGLPVINLEGLGSGGVEEMRVDECTIP